MPVIYKVSAQGMEELEADSVTYATVTIHGMRRNRNSMNPETCYMTDLSTAVIYAQIMNDKALHRAEEEVENLLNAAEEIRLFAKMAKEETKDEPF